MDLIKELIRFPSHSNEPLKIFELIAFIKSYFASHEITVAEYVIDGLPCIVLTTENTKHPHILLSGHIDVVPSSTLYIASIEGDLLYGSGAMDMKGGVACMMAVMKYFASKKDAPSLGLMLTSDEEIGGNGTRKLLQQHNYHADFCIVGEGRHRYDLVNREKGVFAISVSLKAQAFHSAYPWKGRNVLEDLMRFCLNVKAHFPRVRDGWVPTVSVTAMNVRSGHEMNTIPGEVDAVLFFRLTGNKRWNREKILGLIKSLAPSAEIKELVYGDGFFMDPDNPNLKLLKNIAQEVTGKRMHFDDNHGASDVRFFAQNNIPAAILGPVGKDHHTPNESVSISSMVTHFEVLKRFIDEESKIYFESTRKLVS